MIPIVIAATPRDIEGLKLKGFKKKKRGKRKLSDGLKDPRRVVKEQSRMLKNSGY